MTSRPQATAKLIRRVLPDCLIIGGTAFSLYSEEFMRRLPKWTLGFGEKVSNAYRRCSPQNPKEVPGVYYREDGDIKYTGPPTEYPFATLKHPRRDLATTRPTSPVALSLSGFSPNAAARPLHSLFRYVFSRQHSAHAACFDVVDEIEDLVKNHDVRELFFCDQIFNIPPSHAIEICQEIVRRDLDIRWSAWFNENRNTLPDELMIWLKRAGCGLLSFSPDHVDNRMLQALHKNFRYDDMVYTYQVAKRFDFDVEYSFFLNSPGEDWRSLVQIFKFLAAAKFHLGPRLRMFTLLMMQPIRIYPHTKLAKLARETGLIGPDDDLIEARFWNPGSISYAVAGVQASAQFAFRIRQKVRSIRGSDPPSVVR